MSRPEQEVEKHEGGSRELDADPKKVDAVLEGAVTENLRLTRARPCSNQWGLSSCSGPGFGSSMSTLTSLPNTVTETRLPAWGFLSTSQTITHGTARSARMTAEPSTGPADMA